jgi:hypothetical protein
MLRLQSGGRGRSDRQGGMRRGRWNRNIETARVLWNFFRADGAEMVSAADCL